MSKCSILLVTPVATIGFEPVEYSILEGEGMQVFFIFRVLSGNIDFPVNVLFFTSSGSAQGNVSCLGNAQIIMSYECHAVSCRYI